jgi:hypothetical protein
MGMPLERSELAILVLHLNIMRNSIKKGFKVKFGILESKRKMKMYDSIKSKLETVFNEEEKDFYETKFSIDQLETLKEFINWYVKEIRISAVKQKANIDSEETIILLENIKEKVNILSELQGVS